MTTHLVTFSDESMSRSRELCLESGLIHGATVQHRFVADQDDPKTKERGCGFWAWKPQIILSAMEGGAFHAAMPDGDILIYADAGIEFIAPVSHIIERMGYEQPQDDVWLFGNNWEHLHWCKQSVIEVIWPVRGIADVETRMKMTCQRFGKQCQASVIFFRVSEYTRAFVAEWLKWCLWNKGELIDDSPSWIGNHPEFREHRHDQAILTTMAYREGIKLHYWPAMYNRGGSPEFVYEKLPEYAGDTYPVLFSHHRRRNHEWKAVA